jgi:hypothetical protein
MTYTAVNPHACCNRPRPEDAHAAARPPRKPNGHSGHDIDIMENIYITVTYRYDGTMYILDIFGTAKVSWKIDFARVSFARKSSFAFFAGSFI